MHQISNDSPQAIEISMGEVKMLRDISSMLVYFYLIPLSFKSKNQERSHGIH